MKIVRDEAGEKKALQQIKDYLAKKPRSDKGWHVSDLLYPRQTFWRKIKPLPVTDDQALYFSLGHGHHGILEAMLGPKKKDERSDAGEFEKHGILFSPDLRFKDGPLEIKTSRAMYIKADKEDPEIVYEGYLKQLASYNALMDAPQGKLLVLFLNAVKDGLDKWKKKPQLRLYKVAFDAAERKKIVAWLLKRSKLLTAAVKSKKCATLALCPAWMCKNDCPYFKACKPWLVESNRKYLQPLK